MHTAVDGTRLSWHQVRRRPDTPHLRFAPPSGKTDFSTDALDDDDEDEDEEEDDDESSEGLSI